METTQDQEFGQRMRRAREEAGFALVDVEFELRRLLPKPMWVSTATLSRLETKTAEDKADPFLVSVLSALYGCRISEISPLAAASRDLLRDLLERASTWSAALRGMRQFAATA